MPDNILIVDGVNLFTTYKAYAFEREVWVTPEKEATFYSVPGRDGDVLGVNTRMPDVEISYNILIIENAEENMQGLRNFLMSRSGRVRIEHDGDPDHFRTGIFLGPFKPKLTRDKTKVKGVVEFRCQPQRWLDSGASAVSFTPTSGTITNPTRFTSKPLLRIYGYGMLTFSFPYCRITVSQEVQDQYYYMGYVDFDALTQVAKSGSTNVGQFVTIVDPSANRTVEYGGLVPGPNGFNIESTISQVKITPRWWEV